MSIRIEPELIWHGKLFVGMRPAHHHMGGQVEGTAAGLVCVYSPVTKRQHRPPVAWTLEIHNGRVPVKGKGAGALNL
jgi:hypothetical protein